MSLPLVVAVGITAMNASLGWSAIFNVEDVSPIPGGVGDFSAIGLDPSGNPHIVYARAEDLDGAFRYATRNGGPWQMKYVVDKNENYASMIFSGGLPYVGYQDPANTSARFARYDGVNWTTELVDNLFPQEGYYTTPAIDPFGTAHMVYQELSGANNLKHAAFNGSAWAQEDVDGGGTSDEEGRFASFIITPSDTLGISYSGIRRSNIFGLRFAENTVGGLGGGWTRDNVDTTATGVLGTSLAFTPLGSPAIAYINGQFGLSELRYAQRNASGNWIITTLDTAQFLANSVTLRMDSFGLPHIIYRRLTGLGHAYFDGINWHHETIDPNSGAGGTSSMVIGPGDVLHISYTVKVFLYNQRFLRYAHGTAGTWTIEPVEGETEDEGRFIDMTSNGTRNAAIVFYEGSFGDAILAYRNGEFDWRSDWMAEKGDVGRYIQQKHQSLPPTSAQVVFYNATAGTIDQVVGSFDVWGTGFVLPVGTGVAGISRVDSTARVCVAYYDSVAGDLYLGRMGPVGVSKVLVDAAGDVGRSCSAVMDAAGNIHIVYVDSGAHNLKRARSTVSGWVIDTVDASGTVGSDCSAAVKGNAIEVAYYDATHGDLRRARWNGSTWTTSLVDGDGDVGRGCKVAVDGPGDPRYSYYDATRGQLRFAKPLTTGGWDVTVVDSLGDVGRFSTLWVDPETGLSQIGYYNATKGWVRFAYEVADVGSVPPGAVGAVSASSLSVVPNPIGLHRRVRLVMSTREQQSADVRVFDLQGRVVLALRGVMLGGTAPPVELVIPTTSAGVLFVDAQLASGRHVSARLVAMR
jgi:hypothetical protein